VITAKAPVLWSFWVVSFYCFFRSFTQMDPAITAIISPTGRRLSMGLKKLNRKHAALPMNKTSALALIMSSNLPLKVMDCHTSK